MLCCLLVAAKTNLENTAQNSKQIEVMWGVLELLQGVLRYGSFVDSFLVHSENQGKCMLYFFS